MGVIATLTAGFETVNRRLWLLLFPIGLDLLLWSGPQVSITPLVRRVAALWLTSAQVNSYDPQQVILLRQGLEDFGRSFNLLSLLSLTVPSQDVLLRLYTCVFTNILGVPVLTRERGSAMASSPVLAPGIELSEPWILAVATAALLLAGAILSALFLGLIAQIVRDNEVQVPALLRRAGPNAMVMGAYLALGCALFAVVGVPLLVFAAPLVLTQPVVGTLLVVTPWLWLGFYLFFAPSAMLVSEVTPVRAIWYSFNVVRMDLWRSLVFVVSVVVIQAGVSVLWQPLMAWPWGMGVGIVGNAYVSTGLVAATMVFYRERYRQWREMTMGAS